MAYGLKYKAYHWNVDGLQKEIRFYKQDYSGSVTTWLTEKTGLSHSIGSDDTLFPKDAIITSQREFTFVFKQRYDLTEFVYNRKTFKVEIFDVDSAAVEWSGWVEPWGAEHEYKKEPYIATITAGCGLSQLARKRYVNNETETEKTELLILQECLSQMGSDLPLRVSVHLKEVSFSGDVRYGLSSAKIDTNRFYESTGERMYCDIIVNNILQKFSAQLFQHQNKWVIVSTPDHALGTYTSYAEYASIGATPTTASSWINEYTLNTRDENQVAVTLEDGDVRNQAPVNKYRIHLDANPRKGFFYNGDLRLWGVDGLTGWDFTHMPAGSPGWAKINTGNTEYPFALQVNGEGPPLLRWYKKHWYSRKKLKPFEPENYIESSLGTFPPRNNIQISFEYYTGDNVFVFAIRLSSSSNPAKVLWVKPDGSFSSTWEGQAAVQAKEANGKSPKGKVEVSIDLTFVNTISRDSSELFEPYNQVTVRFYQSYHSSIPGPRFYKIYNLLGSSEKQSGIVTYDGIYETELKYLADTDEEGETIDLITGDYAEGFTGTSISATTGEPTRLWTRRGKGEQISIFRAMLIDRLCMTWQPVRIIEVDIKILPGEDPITYLTILVLADMDNTRFKIVRYQYEEYRRIVKVTAVELKYNELPPEVLKTTTIIRGGVVINENGDSDGILPGEEQTGGSIVGDDQVPKTDEEVEDEIDEKLPNTIFDPVDPRLLFVVGVLTTRTVDLEDFYNEDQLDPDIETGVDIPEFSLSLLSKPSWVSSVTFNGLVVSVVGKATVPGYYFVEVLLTDSTSGVSLEIKIPLYASDIKVTPSLINGLTAVKSGTLPGSFKLDNPVDILTTVKGYHNNVKLILTGPDGELLNEFIYAPGTESELADYLAFPGTSGITLDEGLYKLTVEVHSNMIVVFEKEYFFTLYTDEYLSKLKFELWNTVKIGDISIQDTSIFKPVAWFTPRAIIEDTEHDRVILTLYYEGEQIAQEITSYTIAPVMGGVYDVYDTAQTGQKSGKYRINAVILLSDNVIMERQNDFEILAKEPVADGTIKFGTMTANTANFTAVQDLPVTLIEIDLPDEGYNFEYTTVGGDYVRVEFLRKISGVLSAVDLTKYTNQPDYTTVSDLGEKVYAFRTLSSKEIGNLHAPSTVKVRFTERLGGAAGSILSIAEANVKFRVPVDPAELGGLNFIHINNDTAEIRVIDPNMKKVGNVYALPKMPWYWSVAFIKLPTNLEFDRVVGGLKLGGVELHTPGKPGVFDYPVTTENGYPGNVTTKLNTALEAFVAGTWAGTHRTLLNPSDVAVNIDVTGSFKFESVVARLGTPIAFPSAEFELKNEEDIEAETPEEEDGGCCEPKRWNFVALSVWDIPHNMDGYPEFNLIIEGEKWDTEIKYPDSNNAQAVWNRPRTGFAEAK